MKILKNAETILQEEPSELSVLSDRRKREIDSYVEKEELENFIYRIQHWA